MHQLELWAKISHSRHEEGAETEAADLESPFEGESEPDDDASLPLEVILKHVHGHECELGRAAVDKDGSLAAVIPPETDSINFEELVEEEEPEYGCRKRRRKANRLYHQFWHH
jgi:hypothetical protein